MLQTRPLLPVYSLIVIGLLLTAFNLEAQITIGNGTVIAAKPRTIVISSTGINNNSTKADLSNIDLGLTGSKAGALVTASPVTLQGLGIAGNANYTLTGSWTISNGIRLIKGNLIVPTAASNSLTYAGANDITTGSASSYIDGLFFSKGAGTRTFPIGNSAGYFPVVLGGVTDATTALGFQVIQANPNLAPLPAGVTDIFSDHYWQLSAVGGSFSGGSLQLSTLGTDSFLASGKTSTLVVLEEDASNNITNLSGQFIAPVINVKSVSGKGRIYALGKSEDIVVEVVKVITPTSDDAKNNVLQISNIELYPNNKVTLLDRYGVPVKNWTGFKNFTTTTPAQDGIDFASLGIGNYICVVEYTTATGEKKTVSQMVTVLK